MSSDDVPMFRRKRETPRLKFERVENMFFLIPTVVLDKSGIALVWFFWVLTFLWGKEE